MKILTLYFSATGNTKYIAKLFSYKLGSGFCVSIEADVDFASAINDHDTIAFCYPTYGSRVPRIMREFVTTHMEHLRGKKIVILVTQMMFSGDGARVFTELFAPNTIGVIYAEHFNMPNNICNTMFRETDKKKTRQYITKANKKMERVCENIKRGKVKKRGFSPAAQKLGNLQGKTWDKIEQDAKSDLKIHKNCTTCGLCVKICPMKNLETTDNQITHKNNCTTCYRCVNRCPHKAITVWIHRKPKWQYKGLKQ